jgi:hypothetical protein
MRTWGGLVRKLEHPLVHRIQRDLGLLGAPLGARDLQIYLDPVARGCLLLRGCELDPERPVRVLDPEEVAPLLPDSLVFLVGNFSPGRRTP